MEIRKVKAVPKIRRASEFDAPIDDVCSRITKDPTSIWEIADAKPGLMGRFKGRQVQGEFVGVTAKSVGKSIYFTAVEG